MAKSTTTEIRKRVGKLEATNCGLENANRGLEEGNELLKHHNEWPEKELIEQEKENETEKSTIQDGFEELMKEKEAVVASKHKKCNKLKKECEMVRLCLSSVTEMISTGNAASIVKAKSRIADETAHVMVAWVSFLKNKSWRERKILPPRWNLRSTQDNTYCVLVIAAITDMIPSHWDHVFFWHIVVVPTVRNYYNSLRAETGRKLERNVIGKVLTIVLETLRCFSCVISKHNIYLQQQHSCIK